MLEVKRELDFYDLEKECWSGAEDTLKTVREHNMEDELMNFLESYFGEFGETPTMTEVNDLLWFEDEWIFEQIGLEEEDDEDEKISVAVIGRPNVGKSSLVNKILGQQRMIVRDESGTTRDAVDSYIENKHGKFIFTDTAGMRKRGNVDDGVERYSVIRALAAVDRSKVCVIMIDGTVGFTEQDSKIAGYAHEQGKACIIAINKWDAVEKDDKTMDIMRKDLMENFKFMSYAPIIFISAKTGQRLDRLFELIRFVDEQNSISIVSSLGIFFISLK